MISSLLSTRTRQIAIPLPSRKHHGHIDGDNQEPAHSARSSGIEQMMPCEARWLSRGYSPAEVSVGPWACADLGRRVTDDP